MCRQCVSRDKMIMHIVSEGSAIAQKECKMRPSAIPQKEYKMRHEKVATLGHWNLSKKDAPGTCQKLV